jgi:HK97 gp10 family phage protein
MYGLEQLEASITTLKREVATKILDKSLRSGMRIILKDAKARAPRGTEEHGFKEHKARVMVAPGNLKRSLKMKKRGGKTATIGKIQFIIPLDGRAFYGKFIEWGWKTRAGNYIAPKKRFLAEAYNTNKDAALDQVSMMLGDLIQEAAKDANNAR